ncbi:MAG TPA: TIGR02678 family protein [Mycobacteriales bacterium]|nr:TIGR02678 family protein [Mycobacteriales bacterium]
MSNLANQLAVAERAEVARAIRLLLASPLVTERASPDVFDLVRRRAEPVARWFDYHCGWSLVVEPRFGYARLVKIRAEAAGAAGSAGAAGLAGGSARPARRLRSGRAPFDRRRYTLLCVAAAELLSAPVTTIGLLADRVVQATAADPVVPPFDTASRAERMAFADALRLLEAAAVLDVLDGSTDSFVESAESKVLYRVDSTLLIRLLAAPNGPSQLGIPTEEVPGRFDDVLGALMHERRYGWTDEAVISSEVQRNLWLRHSVLRRLFDEPVVYREDLTEAQLGYLTSPTGRQIMRRAVEQAGFVLEERAEGFLLVDAEALATDTKFPDDASNAKVAALLVLDTIIASALGVTPEQVVAEAAGLLRRFPQWARSYRSADGTARLAADALAVLADFGLVRQAGGRIVARPAAARYTVLRADVVGDPGSSDSDGSDNGSDDGGAPR